MTETSVLPIPQVERVPPVVDLDNELARRVDVTGAKAAALARARAARLPALPGFVLTTAGTTALATGRTSRLLAAALHDAWARLSGTGAQALVVRSSSTIEDGGSQSMAGMFRSVLDVRGWEAFLAAIDEVIASGRDAPLAVLVQPYLAPAWGGVLFGADPVTGRADRLVVAAVPGGPDRLVSGEVDGVHLTLSRGGRLVDPADDVPPALRSRRTRRRLVALARQAAATFGGPQDVEWAMEPDGHLVLLQSRPITAVGDEARARGPVFGPGPVAETFGAPLRPLEEDLWLSPLRDGLREALAITATSSARQRRESPIVVSVRGRVAADLDLLGMAGRRRSIWARLDPRPPARRLRAAWRVGRLRVALPALAADLLDRVDADLRAVPPLSSLDTCELLRILHHARPTLAALHGHEVLAGQLIDVADDHPTAASTALRVLAAARAEDPSLDDDELVARHPVLLSLTPPSIGAAITLPPTPSLPTRPSPAAPVPSQGAAGDEAATTREALRLRVRWVHELTGRVAMELGRRLAATGALPEPTAVTELRLEELDALVTSGGATRIEPRDATVPGPPLPAAFRLTEDGVPVPTSAGRPRAARGAGGGRGSGPVHVGTATPPAPGAVLVVRTLAPSLASVLPGLGGLVAETGSVLSHLAILAREYGVPTVVGLEGATERFADGTWVVVDGVTGEVEEIDEGAAAIREWSAA